MKRKLFFILVTLCLIVGVLGFSRGWFVVSRPEPPSGSHKYDIHMAMDADKIKADADAVKNKAAEFTGQATDGGEEPGEQAADRD